MNARAYFVKYQRHGRAAIKRSTKLRRWWIADMAGHLVLCFHSPNPNTGDPIRFIADATEVPASIGQNSDVVECDCLFCRTTVLD